MNTSTPVHAFFRPTMLALAAGLISLLASCAGSGDRPATMTGPDGEVYEEKYIEHHVSADDIAYAKSKAPIESDGVLLYVNGMGCPLCASNIDKQLVRVAGVKTVKVDLGQGHVTLGLTPGAKHPSPYTLGEAVEDAGFTLVKVESR